jgi:hypothetical protein
MTDNDSPAARALHAAFQQVAPDLGASYIPWEDLPDLERRLAVRAVWQAAQGRDFLAAILEEADLERATKALARETVIRSVMAESGEPREIVAEMVDAHTSMDQEAVLDLMEGEPTTLRAALERFVEDLDRRLEGEPGSTSGDVLDGLNAILTYPYPEGDGAHPDVTTVRKADGSVAAFLSTAGTVDGIRPHLPRTPEQDAKERTTAEQWLADNPITPEQVARIMDGTE